MVTAISRIFSGMLMTTLILSLQAPTYSAAQKPKLIHDTAIADGKEEASEKKTYNPMMAEKSVDIGRFYLKKKNYVAAIERFLEALEYQPNRIEAFEELGNAYEKKGDIEQALAVYKDFVTKFPISPKVEDFQKKIVKLEKKQPQH